MYDLINSLQSALLGCPAGLLALLPVGLIVVVLRVLNRGQRQQVIDKARRMAEKQPKRRGR